MKISILFVILIADDGTVSVKNVCVNYDGSYREICGYAEVPDPNFPGELKVSYKAVISNNVLKLLDTVYFFKCV